MALINNHNHTAFKLFKLIILFFLLFIIVKDLIDNNRCNRGTIFDPPKILIPYGEPTGCHIFPPIINILNYTFWTGIFFITMTFYFSLVKKIDILRFEMKRIILALFLNLFSGFFTTTSDRPDAFEMFVYNNRLPIFFDQIKDWIFYLLAAWVIVYFFERLFNLFRSHK